MKLLNLSEPNSKLKVEKFLKIHKHFLSAYSFVDLFIWQDFFKFYYEIINGQLCIFAKDKIGIFLYLPPLGENKNPKTLSWVFKIMDSYNENKQISRIENIEEDNIGFYRDLGYKVYLKSKDYLYNTQDLIGLKGNKFKSKRSSYNHFIKNYKYRCYFYQKNYYDSCLRLFEDWRAQRLKKYDDEYFKILLAQNKSSFKHMLDNADFLEIQGFVVEVNGAIKACSFGHKLNNQTFCIIFEIVDLTIKGLAQFVFREFARSKSNFKYINVMDDSDLENLKRVKLSFRPIRSIKNYCIKSE